MPAPILEIPNESDSLNPSRPNTATIKDEPSRLANEILKSPAVHLGLHSQLMDELNREKEKVKKEREELKKIMDDLKRNSESSKLPSDVQVNLLEEQLRLSKDNSSKLEEELVYCRGELEVLKRPIRGTGLEQDGQKLRKENVELRASILEFETTLDKMKLSHTEELNKLKKENFDLRTSLEDVIRLNRESGVADKKSMQVNLYEYKIENIEKRNSNHNKVPPLWDNQQHAIGEEQILLLNDEIDKLKQENKFLKDTFALKNSSKSTEKIPDISAGIGAQKKMSDLEASLIAANKKIDDFKTKLTQETEKNVN